MPKVDKVARALGNTVRKLRVLRGWTQEQLADKAKTDANFISNIERATRNPSVVKLFSLADAFDMEPSELVRLIDAERRGRLELVLTEKKE